METDYSRNNESTDSFLSSQTLSVVSLRQQNPNLQVIDEESVKRLNTLHKLQRRQQQSLKDNKRTSRYSFSPTQSSQLTPSVTGETGDIDHLTHNMRIQNFWKYHIISIGKNQFYLTTNPDIKHLYCRNGPGYFVQLVLPRLLPSTNRKQSDIGFRLIFKRQVYDELDTEDNLKDPKECIVVTKSSKEEGGGFNVVLLMMNGLNGYLNENPITLKTTAEEKPIDELIKLLQKDPTNLELQKLVPTFHRYELHLENDAYLIGSNPIAKQKTSHRLKINQDIFKLTGKQNVYFYTKKGNRTSSQANGFNSGNSKRRSFLKNLRPETQSVKVDDDDKILALFRPHERRFKKKIIKTLNSSSASTTSTLTDASSNSEDYNYIENDQYYKPGDGLNQLNPKDDSPNESKIGWITIFEDLAAVQLWELVLGYTFAVGFDRLVDDYIRE